MPSPESTLSDAIEMALDERPRSLIELHGGCVAQVFTAEFEIHDTVAVKYEPDTRSGTMPGLHTEGFMLDHLAAHTALPLPRVLHAEPTLLILEFIENDGARSDRGEVELADLMAELHETKSESAEFGLEQDTRIGPLEQPNEPNSSWAVFYRDQRLIRFGQLARDRGGITTSTLESLKRLADDLESHLAPTAADPPRLLHGDLWAGNILWDQGSPRALIDPACYRGHPEVELAFIDLMGGLGRAFWERYESRRPLAPGWENRRGIYQLYPLLVHAILFDGGVGGVYGQSVAATLLELGV